ncbi:MAG: peptidylprolyl isomerase [Phycisphaerales bacterium]|nr:peptidylprolyl isomerase [Phycisphaerales bacterium]
MKMWMIVVGMLAMAVSGLPVVAAVVAPEKRYVKPDEAVVVRFLNETEAGKKAMGKIGLAAMELEGMYKEARRGEVADASGMPLFAVYTFEGKKLEGAGKVEWANEGEHSEVKLSSVFPQVKEAGTYLLVWKDATPLVIQTLGNPVPWSALMDAASGQREAVQKQVKDQPPVVTHMGLLEYGVITTNKGPIEVKFAYDVAPHTVDNFISLAREQFYDGSAFHRIIAGFMIQGGDSLATVPGRAGTGGPGYAVAAEFSEKLHERGTLSMARSAAVDSAGSQFFIMHQKTPHLDGQYTAFGDVIGGMNVVDELVKTPVADKNGTVAGEKPKIESVRVLPATLEMYGVKK